ncbi:MAG TPA: L,D-transpeptidase family protein [Sphingobium sp.]|nr:L,D-transpeptidase family protein [Sphingobium sp.]
MIASLGLGVAQPLVAAPAPARQPAVRQPSASAADGQEAIAQAIRARAGGALKRFYAERGFHPLWTKGATIGPQAETLIGFLRTADLDGLRPARYAVDDLAAAVRAARAGDPAAVARAELALSTSFARYVQDQRRSRAEMTYTDKSLKPKTLKPEAILRAAAFPKPFAAYVADMGWMSPHYVSLRKLVAGAKKQGLADAGMARLFRNLDRARLLPGPWTRHIVVDASSGRLWYYQAGKQVGMMKVVVGAQETQTPMLAGMVQWAILNPYWNVPTYLAQKSIAPKILGGRTLASMKMEALSDWSEAARPLDPGTIDWKAVASGAREIRLRELPGSHNSMGRVKFLFPNDEGIYLHDTPDRALLKKPDRHFSNGCIRLEDAPALGRWLLGQPITAAGKAPEQAVALRASVPIYLTYLTATATPKGVAFRNDIYGRDD